MNFPQFISQNSRYNVLDLGEVNEDYLNIICQYFEQHVNNLTEEDLQTHIFQSLYQLPKHLYIPILDPVIQKTSTGQWMVKSNIKNIYDFKKCWLIDWLDQLFELSQTMDVVYSCFDWISVYQEDSFVDNDGACILMNCNPISSLYQRFMVYESFDEVQFTILKPEWTLTSIIEHSKTFIPEPDEGDWMNNWDCYFVSYLVELDNHRT